MDDLYGAMITFHKTDTLQDVVLKLAGHLDIEIGHEDISAEDVPEDVAEEIREDLRDELRNEYDIYDELVGSALEPFSGLEDTLAPLVDQLESVARDAQDMLDAIRNY